MALVAAPQTSIEAFTKSEAGIAGSYNLLFIEEPWVQQNVSESCDHALSSYYETLRGGHASIMAAASYLRTACDLGNGKWGFTEKSYVTAVQNIETREKIAVKAFLGWSFASVRWSYLSKWHLNWSVLLRPHPLVATGQQIVQARASAAERQIEKKAGHSIVPVKNANLESRSVPVTGFDQLSAIVRSAYLDNDAFSRNMMRGIVLGSNPQEIGTYSDAVWGRYDVDSISPSYLAQLDEGCVANGSWPEAAPQLKSARDLLEDFWAPCHGITAAKPGAGPDGRLCLVVSGPDPVVPGSLSSQALAAASSSRFTVRVDDRQHSSDAGLSSCLRHVMAGI
jgi:hypothetical protein